MSSLVVEVLLGVYLGLLTGIVPAMVAGGLGFAFKYLTGVTLPGLGVVVLAVAIAGVSGGLLGLIDPAISASPRLMVALVVVMMLSLYAHAQGDRLGSQLPRRFSLRELGTRTLAADAITTVGGFGRIDITPKGDVRDLEGYPPLSVELRDELAGGSWTFRADVPIEELERRLEDRLRAQHALTEVDVEIDARGRARIAAAPPMGSLSRRLPDGHRAVSIDALVPTGIARGERVELWVDDRTIDGSVVSAKSDPSAPPAVVTDGGSDEPTQPEATTAPQTTGGEGRVTVAVTRDDARFLLSHDRARVIVLPRGMGLEFEAVRLLREAGNRFRRRSVTPSLAGSTVADLEQSTNVTILAIRRQERSAAGERTWTVSPVGSVSLAHGDDLIAMGPTDAITALEARTA